MEKWRWKWIRCFSMKIPLTLCMVLLGFIPMLLESRILISTYRQSQLDFRMIEVQNQCQILSNKMTRSGYMAADIKDTMLDSEMDFMADMFNGRIVVVDRDYRIVKDTFNLAEGRIHISEEVIRCFQGEGSSRYHKKKHYLAQALPVYDNSPDKRIEGVILVTATTENILSMSDSVAEKASFFQVMIVMILSVVSVVAVFFLVRPFKELQHLLNRVADGELETELEADTYRETREISQAVSRTLKKLKDMDQSRQEFVSNVSHELKTPITSIRVLADSLMGMEEVPVELYREFMMDISDEIDRESKIIDDLLTLVKMDKSSTDLNIAQVDINALLELILKRLRPIANRRKVELVFESIREVLADVDEVKLSLALTNLVENAIKYNVENGWVRVTLDADHQFFYVKVSDSGIGIPEEFHDHIFERFYRVDKARSRETGGSGLGLSITKSVILMHQGAVKVSSKEGEGTVFTVRIPLNYIG